MSKESDTANKESLSALLDGETDELELRRLLRTLPEDAELSATWERYNMARSVLHGEPVGATNSDTTRRIMAAVANESAPAAKLAKSAGGGSSWRESLGKAGVAASVALVFFVGMQTLSTTDQTAGGGLVQQDPAPANVDRAESDTAEPVFLADSPDGTSSPNGTSNGTSAAEAQQRLNDYIQEVSIRYRNSQPDYNVLEDSPLVRAVNQVQD